MRITKMSRRITVNEKFVRLCWKCLIVMKIMQMIPRGLKIDSFISSYAKHNLFFFLLTWSTTWMWFCKIDPFIAAFFLLLYVLYRAVKWSNCTSGWNINPRAICLLRPFHSPHKVTLRAFLQSCLKSLLASPQIHSETLMGPCITDRCETSADWRSASRSQVWMFLLTCSVSRNLLAQRDTAVGRWKDGKQLMIHRAKRLRCDRCNCACGKLLCVENIKLWP